MTGLVELKKGEALHDQKEPVTSLELVLSGTITVDTGFFTLDLGAGTILELLETPGASYRFSYQAKTDTKVYSYDYIGEEDTVRLIRSNARIAPQVASQTLKLAVELYEAYTSAFEKVRMEYQEMALDLEEYPFLAAKAGGEEKDFPELSEIYAPEDMVFPGGWQISYLRKRLEKDQVFRTELYPASVDFCMGTIMMTQALIRETAEGLRTIFFYEKDLKEKAGGLKRETGLLKVMVKAKEKALDQAAGAEDGKPPVFSDTAETIIAYSGLPSGKAREFLDLIKAYRKVGDRTDVSDDLRRMRKQVSALFYETYRLAFLKSRKDKTPVPPEVRLFFLFGFLDEKLAGDRLTGELYRLLKAYHPDPEGKVYPIYAWLTLIYEGKVPPSKNEFDQDYPAFLREQKRNGEITEEEEKSLLSDPEKRVSFEMDSLFRQGNRMTFGRISSFQPLFDEQNANVDLARGFLTSEKVHAAVERVSSIDFSCFYREKDYTNEALGIRAVPVHKKVLPYIILFPNVGSRAALWQEIEGKRRDTPARMMLPIFFAEDLNKGMVSLAGEFRWEMTKTEQGVRWNDLSTPSLTAEYADYIQYYRKNHSLSPEQKEKVRKKLSKVGNNLRRAFVSDYMVYMNSESKGSPLMNRVTRQILFTYCPFAKEIRERLNASPQYTELLQKHEIHETGKIRPLAGVVRRLEKNGDPVPKELLSEIDFLKM